MQSCTKTLITYNNYSILKKLIVSTITGKKTKCFFLTKVSSCGFTGEPKAISTEGDSSDNNLTDNSGIGDGVESYKGKSKLTTNPKTSSSMTYDFIIKKGGDPVQDKYIYIAYSKEWQ